MTEVRIGVKLPSSGPIARRVGLAAASIAAEAVGFDSVWVSDHVVMLRGLGSQYPFSAGGAVPWDGTEPWYDAVVAMATAAAVTERVEIGAAVLILPMRNPVVLAKQLASIDALSGGRVAVGAGAGWLAEEFGVLQAPFERRGALLDEWIPLLRDCWTGTPKSRSSESYPLPDGVLCYPTPVGLMPVLVGGMSRAALQRAGRIGDGWLAQQDAGELDPGVVERARAVIEGAAAAAGRPVPERVVLRIAGPAAAAARQLPDLAAAGVTDVIVDVDWADPAGAARVAEALRE
jgi:probable F420-dependent oxidoreductase